MTDVWYTREEIICSINEAARPWEQIYILAELNECEPEDIAEVAGLKILLPRYPSAAKGQRTREAKGVRRGVRHG